MVSTLPYAAAVDFQVLYARRFDRSETRTMPIFLPSKSQAVRIDNNFYGYIRVVNCDEKSSVYLFAVVLALQHFVSRHRGLMGKTSDA